ncbi:MAG: hypothetical protein M3040_06025, partial [Bacteroidota bacterium]|nr:hypothetical protein [Bacteroidota bacterium]
MLRKIFTVHSLHAVFFKAVLFILVFPASYSSMAQPAKTEVIFKKITDYNDQNLQEKLFVHTDRTTYVAGEIIWFKVYCTDAKNTQPSSLSKVAYVEVLDKDQQPVVQGKITLINGSGSGSFVIPATIHSGNFVLRSYTNWMKNFDPEFYYHQHLTIVNTVKGEFISIVKTEPTYDAKFFPEGGNLVNGLTSKVAFRVTDNSGKGIDFTGTLVDQSDDAIVSFHPQKFGIGNFTFTPEKGKQYRVVLKVKNGNVINSNLPSALNAGFVLIVTDPSAGGAVKMNVRTTTGDRHCFVMVHNQRATTASKLLILENGTVDYEIDRAGLSDGISTITLFNENGQPVCERLYFKKPRQQQLVISGNADNTQYATRKKVTINVSSEDEAATPQASDLSMAVFLLDSLPLQNQSIYQYLWLSSDLKGTIESPQYYFENGSAEVNEAIDNLMLTHGWRRFKWNDVLGDKKPTYKFLPEYEGHIVAGRMVNKSNEMPAPGVLGFLSVPGPLFQLYAARSAADGSVYFNTKNFYGTKLIVAQGKSNNDSLFRVDILSPFSENFADHTAPFFNNYQVSSAMLLKRSIGMQVQNVYTGEKQNLLQAVNTDTTNFYGKPDARYLLDDYVRFPTMEEVLREY